MIRSHILMMSAVLAASCCASWAVAEPLPPVVAGFLSRHCLACHDAATAEGNVSLELPAVDWHSPAFAALAERLHRVLAAGDMPPAGESRPDGAATAEVLDWLDSGLVQNVPAHGTQPRRLNRTEYTNTIRHAIRYIAFDLPSTFPKDSRSHGFDNVAAALVLSPPLLDAYTEAATLVADQVFLPPKPPLPTAKQWNVSPAEMGSSAGFGPSSLLVDGRMRLAFADRGGYSDAAKFAAPVSGIYRITVKASAHRPEPGQPMTLDILCGSGFKVATKLTSIPVPAQAPVEVTFEAPLFEGRSVVASFANSPNRTIDANFPHATLADEMRTRFARHPRVLAALLSLHDSRQDAGGTATLRLRGAEKLGFESRKVFVNEAFATAVARPDLDLMSATPEAAEQVIRFLLHDRFDNAPGGALNLHTYGEAYLRDCFSEGPAVDVHSLVIEGPLAPAEDDRDRAAHGARTTLFGTRAYAPDEPAWLARALTNMLTRLFRREVPAEDVSRYQQIVASHRAAGHSADEALHLALRTALVSPHFLYRELRDGGFDVFDLASRLSFMLTLRPPDDKLFAAAKDGSLADPEVLRAHATRLLAGRESAEFLTSFISQWLDLRLLAEIMPDPSLGAFTDIHRRGMTDEATSVLAELVRDNRPVRDMIDPDFTYVNPVLGRDIYKLDGMPVPDIRNRTTALRVSVPRGGRLGGLLGMAGVMMATANGVDTQPVIRGKWVLENILGETVPPPPDAVPALTPDTRGAKTIRDLMAAHTTDAGCAGCHRRLDPLGLALENYDPLGRWRDVYPLHDTNADGRTLLKPGPPVDASATLPDGTAIHDAVDLKRYVAEHVDRFAGCLAAKLFLYGTGRIPTYAERKQIDAAVASVLARGGGCRDLILAVIDTESFRTR